MAGSVFAAALRTRSSAKGVSLGFANHDRTPSMSLCRVGL